MKNSKNKSINGEVWSEFCDSLKRSGLIILNEKSLSDLDFYEGWRYLTRLTRLGLEMALENNDPYFPTFYSLSHETAKIGADNPDNLYLNATINGDFDYRIWGERGTVHYLSFGSKTNKYDKDGTMATTGELDIKNVNLKKDNSFEIILSKLARESNWLPVSKESNLVIVRQTFLDKQNEEPANINIECLNAPNLPIPLSEKSLVQSLKTVSAFVEGTASTFTDWTNLFKQKTNQLPLQDQRMYQKAGGDPNIHYIHGYWKLEDDEVLLINTKIPKCDYWNFQLDNYWMESLDYRYHRISINNHSADLEPDGSLKIVVSSSDPKVNNWIETAGHKQGTMLLRWVNAEEHPQPFTEVKRKSELQK